jgi:serine/threonine-protein kinase HipA
MSGNPDIHADLCQATSTPTVAKYEAEGGPSLRTVAALLDTWTRSADELDQLTRVMALNIVVGNADAHAKNFSLLHHPTRGVELAPLYDVASTIAYPAMQTDDGPRPVGTSLAMRVNEVDDINGVTREDLVAEAATWDYGAPRARRVVEEFLVRVPEALAEAVRQTPDASEEQVELIAARVEALTQGKPAGFD